MARVRNHSSRAGTPDTKSARSCSRLKSSKRTIIWPDLFDLFAVAPKRGNQARRRSRRIDDRLQEGVAIRTTKHHALVVLENASRALVGKVPRCKPGDRGGALDELVYGGSDAQLHPGGFVLASLLFPCGLCHASIVRHHAV